jgi:hypothetical protein
MPATESKPIFVALCLPTAKWRYWPHFGDAKSSALGQA